jgi:Endonuclease/Exonuclease/phosphatase family
VVLAAVVAGVLLISGSASPTAGERGVVLVTANLREAYGADDLADLGEMAIFVDRLLQQLPRRPDVLLLQEVRHSSATRVARLLTRAVGDSYGVIVDPGRHPARHRARRSVFRNTGIVINRATMKRLAGGGFIGNAYGNRVGQNAYTLVAQRGARVRLALMSVHLMPHHLRATARWVDKDARLLRRKYPRAQLRIMAGDFNADRCRRWAPHCTPVAFYRTLVRKPYSYKDVVRAAAKRRRGGVDYVFATGTPVTAGVDLRGKGLYSDHAFRWGLVTR